MNFDKKHQKEIEDAFIQRLQKRLKERARHAFLSLTSLVVFIGSFFIIMLQFLITNILAIIHIMNGMSAVENLNDMWEIYATLKLYSFGELYISYILPSVLFFVSDISYKIINPKEPDLIIEICKAFKKRLL